MQLHIHIVETETSLETQQ